MIYRQISVAKAKSHISELIAKSQYSHERFIITRRNKPVAALVSIVKPRPSTKLLKQLANTAKKQQYISTITVSEIVYGTQKS